MINENIMAGKNLSSHSLSSKWVTFSLIPMSLLLNQANVVFNINFSFSDFFLCMLVIVLGAKGEIQIPIRFLGFFLILSVVTISTAVWAAPVIFHVAPDYIGIIQEYVKLCALFLYCIVGYNLTKMGYLTKVIKWFSIGAVMIGIIAIIYTALPITNFHSLLYFDDLRYRGLMNDPNYFSVVQASAIVYYMFNKKNKAIFRLVNIAILGFSILVTGSKTGMIILLALFGLKGFEWLFRQGRGLLRLLFVTVLFILLIVFALIVVQNFSEVISYISSFIPGFQRVEVLFTDFNSAIHSEGSTRDLTWGNALQLIQLSPIFGIGIGSYSNIAMALFGSNVIAHNTYLQLFAEWGSLLAIVFFIYLFYTMLIVSIDRKRAHSASLLIRNMMIPFIIGSLSLSLNNARLLWILLGALTFYIMNKNFNKIYRKEENEWITE